jgi:hypothetical protein
MKQLSLIDRQEYLLLCVALYFIYRKIEVGHVHEEH